MQMTRKMSIHSLMAGAAVAVIIAAAPPPAVAQAGPGCANCGVVTSVKPVRQQARTSKVGLIGGAVVGGLVGNEIGDGNPLATAGGAVGGAYLGNKIGQRVQSGTRYRVVVRMDNGGTRTLTYASNPGFRTGSHVRVVNGRLVSASA